MHFQKSLENLKRLLALAAAGILLLSSFQCSADPDLNGKWTALHQWTPLAADITLVQPPCMGRCNIQLSNSNVTASWKILHLTDAHISLSEATEHHPYGTRRMHNAFRSVRDQYLEPGKSRPPSETFERLMMLIQRHTPDVLVLGGDIVNYPHNSSVQFVLQQLKTTVAQRIPIIFTAGNHDWMVEAHQWSLAEQHRNFRLKELKPLYRLQRHHTSRRLSEQQDVGLLELKAKRGSKLLILSIDNSRMEINSNQASFVLEQLSRGLPVLLIIHVPLMLPGISPKNNKHVMCGDPRYCWQGDKLWNIEKRERWPREGPSSSTLKFIQDVMHQYAAPRGPLLGILSGHEHVHRTDVIGALHCGGDSGHRCLRNVLAEQLPQYEGMVQYVTPAACDGGHRVIEIHDARSSWQ
eukprot:TRINITY_DN22075_c0_g1_i1.p1 TRINITY_DN22075_c0_g1~~TRINITY_DN22075_c0_g1_i1.p1  ORF type:complete len:409 (-),score=28.58 TRINITY_DN22075_c0_g1_i1:22-1248(-)